MVIFNKLIRPTFNDMVSTQPELGISSREAFHQAINRERARANRDGKTFSVIVFELNRNIQNGSFLRNLAKAIHIRVRLTDVVGWFEEDRVGVILHNTDSRDALNVANDIVGSVRSQTAPIDFQILTYPSAFLSGDRSYNQTQQKMSSGSAGNSSSAPKQTSSSCSDHLCESSSHQDSLCIESIAHQPVEALEPLLASPLPLWKRTIDVVGAAIGLIVLSPFFLLIASAIKTFSRGPVFFQQQRIGYLGRPFTFWKFRTMKAHADSAGHKEYMCTLINCEQPMEKLDEDNSDIIPVIGSFLRKSCLDELPQLINVLRGEMSLVGPRPCLPYEFREYLLWHKERMFTVPGMTGLWQVNGKNATTFKEMIRFDITYERKRSLWLDLQILAKTVPVLVCQLFERSSLKETASNGTSA